MTEEDLAAIEKRAQVGAWGIESEGGGPAFDAYQTCTDDVPYLAAEIRWLWTVIHMLKPAPTTALTTAQATPDDASDKLV